MSLCIGHDTIRYVSSHSLVCHYWYRLMSLYLGHDTLRYVSSHSLVCYYWYRVIVFVSRS